MRGSAKAEQRQGGTRRDCSRVEELSNLSPVALGQPCTPRSGLCASVSDCVCVCRYGKVTNE